MAKLRVDKIAAPIVKDEFTGSVQFDGTGDYLSVADNGDFDASGDFTIEFWANLSLTDSDAWLVSKYDSGNNRREYIVTVNSSGNVSFYWSTDGSTHGALQTGNGTISAYEWNHYAWVKNGSVLTGYINGVALVSKTDLTSQYNNSATPLYVGSLDGSQSFKGYISNLRICKGHAVYTENFTVPTRELPVHKAPPKGVVFPAADNRTVLLACQSSTDTTAEATGRHILTANGNATAADANPGLFRRTLNLTTVTENTGAVFFDGPTDGGAVATDSIILASSPDFNWGTGDFTVETWVYGTDWTGGSSNQDQVIYYHNEETAGFFVRAGALHYYNGGFVVSGPTLEDTRWYHLAAARQSGTLTLYVDGVSQGSASHTDDYGEGGITIGKNSSNSKNQFRGYLSNLRICKGHAVYTSNFAPPTRELEVHEGPDDDRTVLLCCYDGENIFADKTGRHVLMAYGDRTSSPTPTATDSPIGITTHNPGLTRNVDPTAGPTFQGGAGYTSQNWLTLPKGTTTERFVEVANNAVSASSARGLFLGGSSPTQRNTIDYITIPTAGNAKDFGDLTAAHQYVTSVSSNTRGVNGGGDPTTNIIDYVTISTLGNAKDFGDLFTGRYGTGGCSSGVRGVWAGGVSPSRVNTMDYVTIASTGNAKDFGDLTEAKNYLTGCGSPSRGLFAGGMTPTKINTIDFITIASMGNAFDFGDLTEGRNALAGCSNSIRGVFGGGNTPTMVNIIDYVDIPTTGNAVDFGDISVLRENMGACSSKTRGVFGGGNDPSNTKLYTIDFVEFATLGDATDFGDLTQNRKGIAGCSNGHGGLG